MSMLLRNHPTAKCVSAEPPTKLPSTDTGVQGDKRERFDGARCLVRVLSKLVQTPFLFARMCP